MNAFHLSFKLNGPQVYRQIVLAETRGAAITKLTDYLHSCGVDCRIQIVGVQQVKKFQGTQNVVCC